MAPPRIDSHVHFWRIESYAAYWLTGGFAPLHRDWLPDDLAPRLRAAGVDGAIFVQAQHVEADNAWVLGLADRYPFVRGVVGWVDLTAPDVGSRIDHWRADPRFVGVRHITHDEPDDDWILRADVDRGLAELARRRVPFDLLFFPRHMPHAATVARRHPELPLVLDHLGKPRIRDGAIDDWLPHLRNAAAHPNLCCKLSGLVTEAVWHDWDVPRLRRYVDLALEAFGPDRLLLGSDWPVCEVVAPYARVVETLIETLDGLAAHERDAILGGNACRVYALPDAPAAR
ncbi:MAG: amidohydrolase family protein [Planctomycetes bacterium]|nr:amidohydrolase family protein [Planctomycetota bacterium]